jgi:hypothetical protein
MQGVDEGNDERKAARDEPTAAIFGALSQQAGHDAAVFGAFGRQAGNEAAAARVTELLSVDDL